jgi:hypothetical protein
MNVLKERARTHGDYNRTARLAQDLKTRIRAEDHRLSHAQLEALEMICVKMARIVCGNPDEPDHWIDVQGYAALGMGHTSSHISEEPDELFVNA